MPIRLTGNLILWRGKEHELHYENINGSASWICRAIYSNSAS